LKPESVNPTKIKPIIRTKERVAAAPSTSTASTARLSTILSGRGKVPFQQDKGCLPAKKSEDKKD
jgi:hypothetical protein